MVPAAWRDLPTDDTRALLIGAVGYRFGQHPETRLIDIRADRVRYARRFIRMADITRRDRVLEIGSGLGFGTRAFSRAAQSVVATDISPAYLAYAAHECGDLDNVRFELITGGDFAFLPPAEVDVVVAVSVFIHLNLYDIDRYFAELARVVRPGGRVCFDFADMDRLFPRWREGRQDGGFIEHAALYRADPQQLFSLLQWNSARGIRRIARRQGFRFLYRQSLRLLFQRR